MRWAYLETTYAVGAVAIDPDTKIVRDACPIYRWMIGKRTDVIKQGLVRRGVFIRSIWLDTVTEDN